MPDYRTEAGRQMVKEAGWGIIASMAAKYGLPFLLKYGPKMLKWIPGIGKMLAGHAGKAQLWKTLGHGALRGAKWGGAVGGGMGALGGAMGAAPGESRLLAALRGGAGGALRGGLAGGAIGGVGGGLRYGLAPRMYRGAGMMRVGPGGKPIPVSPASLSPAQAREIALSGGRFTHTPGYGRAAAQHIMKPRGLGRAISWLPGAATMGLYSLGGGGGGAPVPVPGAGMVPRDWPKAAARLGGLVKTAKAERVKALVLVLEKPAGLPQFNPMPLSSHTAIAGYIKNRKYKAEPNEATSDEQALLNRLVAGMSKSRARAVGEHRRARNKPQSLLKHHFQAAGLWS